ncbi:uncharacterized protein [Watersipora subatra]|uniref:uncharacterized protein n=1 Tax=Watersipora subatra TaxID=2589382 RepID=UPI00355B8ADD
MAAKERVDQQEKPKTKSCLEHKSKAYSHGCRLCLKVFCTDCIPAETTCDCGITQDGKNVHELLTIKDFLKSFAVILEKQRETLMSKEAQLSALLNRASKDISIYEQETQAMVNKLHTTRNAQILAIQSTYKDIERVLLESRRRTHKDMTNFMNNEVSTMLSTLRSQRAKIDSRLKKAPQMNTFRQYQETQKEIKQLSNQQLPTLTLKNGLKVHFGDERRHAEAELVPENDIVICNDSTTHTSSPPQSSTLTGFVKTKSFCHSVCHYQGITYVGTQNCTIDAIGQDCEQTTIVTLNDKHWAYGIDIKEDKIYSLITDNECSSCVINVYDLFGQLIKQWRRNDRCHYTRLAVTSEKVLLADHSERKLMVYSVDGQLVKDIVCPDIDLPSSVCFTDSESAVITTYDASLIFKLCLNSGEQKWRCTKIDHPEAVALYGEKLVCVASEGKLSFLDITNGELVSQLEAHQLVRSDGYHYIDIDITGHTLVASCKEGGFNKLLYFNISAISPTCHS